MKFLLYEGRHGELLLTEHSQVAWDFLRNEMDNDNRCTLDEIRQDFGDDAICGNLEYYHDAHLSIDDGGNISTIELTEVLMEPVVDTGDLWACSGCGATAPVGTEGWKTTDAHWCPKCIWLA